VKSCLGCPNSGYWHYACNVALMSASQFACGIRECFPGVWQGSGKEAVDDESPEDSIYFCLCPQISLRVSSRAYLLLQLVKEL
jgi:hypothetical protein